MDRIAVFIEHYTIGNSPSIINLLDFLSDHYYVDLFLRYVSLKNSRVLRKPNITIIDNFENVSLSSLKQALNLSSQSYMHYICIDPHGFVLCKDLFPDSQPIYYSLELYMKDGHFGLHYPKEVMEKERSQINTIMGLIIQSREKERLFRADYNLSDQIPIFILPVTYQGGAVLEKSPYLREKYNIPQNIKIALHLGGIAKWFSCIELARTFSHFEDVVLVFHGYPDLKYLKKLISSLHQENITNVIISDQIFDNIEDVDRIVMSCDIGIAWYNDISTGFRTAGRSSSKIPAYLRFGLPVIAKKYPSTLEALEDNGCGICVDDFDDVNSALSQIRRNYAEYSENARNEYLNTYRFEKYKNRLLRFIDVDHWGQVVISGFSERVSPHVQKDNDRNHFNWDKLMENKSVEEFLASPELWGDNQGPDNPGRVAWRDYLKSKAHNKNLRVLEIGFGSGIDYKALASTGVLDDGQIEYFGADVTKKFVEYAKQHFTKMKPFLIDGYRLPFKDQYFDIVYLRHVLEHQTHYRQLLSEIFRVCLGEVFIIFFIELTESDKDDIKFDGTWYHNKYSRKLFHAFGEKHGFDVNEVATYRTEGKSDAIIICTRKPKVSQASFSSESPCNIRSDVATATQNQQALSVRFSCKNRTFPEVNKWDLSEFVAKKLVNIVGVKPFPLDELLFMCSSVAYFTPDIIIEWGTHVGKSARVFYETVEYLEIKTEIHSIDLPPEADHVENIKDQEQRGMFVRGLPVTLHLGDGLEIATKIIKSRKFDFPLFFVDGDHSYKTVYCELNGIKKLTNNAAILVHDTFYQGEESNYNIGPFQAVKKFSEENDTCIWSTNLGLPGMSLLWLGGPSLNTSGQKMVLESKQKESEPPISKEVINKLHKHSENLTLSILHTVEFYHPHVGGAETVVQQISERLAKRGHRVEVATTKLPERNFKELNGVTIHEFDVAGNLAVGVRGSDFHRYQEFLINHPANVMMNYAAQQWATDLAFFALESTQNKRVNIIAPCGYSALEDARTLRWPQFADYFGKIIPVVIPYYDAAIYHSSMYKDYEFAQLYGFQNSIVIPNGVDEEEFSQQTSVSFKEKYGITTPYMGLCVANYYRDKGHDRIIEAVRQMNRKDFTMVFIGKDGDELQSLKKQSADLNIKFLVNIPREDTVAAFHEADIFLFGSYIEASPLVIIEAKASKTPFISTDCGNVKEWKGGIVCAPEEMAENANRILDKESLRKQLAEEGYKEWKEKQTWEAVVDKYEELYLRLYQNKIDHSKKPISITPGISHPSVIQKPSIDEIYGDIGYFTLKHPATDKYFYANWGSRRWEYCYVEGLLNEINIKNKIVVDIGIGLPTDFNFYTHYVQSGCILIAYDPDERLQENDTYLSPNCCILKKSAEKMEEIQNNSVDVVVSISSLEHFPVDEFFLTIKEVYRILKDEGYLIITLDLTNDKTKSARWAILEKSLNGLGFFENDEKLKSGSTPLTLEYFLELISPYFALINNNIHNDKLPLKELVHSQEWNSHVAYLHFRKKHNPYIHLPGNIELFEDTQKLDSISNKKLIHFRGTNSIVKEINEKLKRYNKVVVWGLKSVSSTHRPIHSHFFSTLKKIGVRAVWVDNLPEYQVVVEKNDIVIGFNLASSYLPLRPDAYYCLHNCGEELLRQLNPSKLLQLQVYTDVCVPANAYKIGDVTFFDPTNRMLFQPWAADLLSEEFETPVLNPFKSKIVYWVGSIWNNEYNQGNIAEMDKLRDSLQKKDITFRHLQGVSDEEHKLLIRASHIAPAIAGRWQSENNYLPCRVWKNISYGQLGITNVKKFEEIFSNCIITSDNIDEIIERTLELTERKYRERVFEQQEIVKANHTYLNRILNILNAFEWIETGRMPSFKTVENGETQLIEKLQKDFRNVEALIHLAEIEMDRSNQKKAKNYLIAALAIEPQNVAAKTLLEKLQEGEGFEDSRGQGAKC